VAAQAGAAGAPGLPRLEQALALGARYGADAWALRLAFAEAAILGAPGAAPGAAPAGRSPGAAAAGGGAGAPDGPAAAVDAPPADSLIGQGPGPADPRGALAGVQAALLQRPAPLLAALAAGVLPALGAASAVAARGPGAGPDAGRPASRPAPAALAAALALAEEALRLCGAQGGQARPPPAPVAAPGAAEHCRGRRAGTVHAARCVAPSVTPSARMSGERVAPRLTSGARARRTRQAQRSSCVRHACLCSAPSALPRRWTPGRSWRRWSRAR